MAGRAGGGRTLLIVDDSPGIRAALVAYFRRDRRWDAVVSADAADAGVQLAEEHEPDAIVLDNRMPNGSGLDAVAALRRACPGARIVMHTIADTPDVRETALDLGVDAFLAKGAPIAELDALLGATSS